MTHLITASCKAVGSRPSSPLSHCHLPQLILSTPYLQQPWPPSQAHQSTPRLSKISGRAATAVQPRPRHQKPSSLHLLTAAASILPVCPCPLPSHHRSHEKIISRQSLRQSTILFAASARPPTDCTVTTILHIALRTNVESR